MTKPQGYRQSAAEAAFYALVICLPLYRALVLEGLGRTIVVLLLACLLLFMVERSAEVCRLVADRVRAVCSLWFVQVRGRECRAVALASLAVPRMPSRAALFQRPPPIFS